MRLSATALAEVEQVGDSGPSVVKTQVPAYENAMRTDGREPYDLSQDPKRAPR